MGADTTSCRPAPQSCERCDQAGTYTCDMDPREDELLTHVAAGTDIWSGLTATSEDEQPPKSGLSDGDLGSRHLVGGLQTGSLFAQWL
jgi:hypothetical protein